MSYTVRQGTVHRESDVGTPVMGVGQDGAYKALDQRTLEPDPFSTIELNVPAANTAAVITLAAPGEGLAHVITGVVVSYDADPSGGKLTIEDGDETVFDVDIPDPGSFVIPFVPPRRGRRNKAMVITLAAGGDSVQGKVNLLGHWIVPVLFIGAFQFDEDDQSQMLPLLF